MSCQEEVIKIGKKLEKMSSSGTADSAVSKDLLNTLKKQPMTLEVLQKTRIGMCVNNFRKACTSDDVVSLAKSLIKSWKKLLPENSSQSSTLSRSNSTASTTSQGSQIEKESEDSSNQSPPQDTPDTPTSPETKQKSFPTKASDTNDTIRLKCREMLTNSLKMSDIPPGSGDPEELAAGIEECIFLEFGDTGTKYKGRIRSRVANLRDKKNPELREHVLTGFIQPEKIAVMTAEEMASSELKNLRAKFHKDAINDHQMSTQGGTETDLLQCSKCKQRRCTYNQVQTRSADEPMTTFVLCLNCGKRWKFC